MNEQVCIYGGYMTEYLQPNQLREGNFYYVMEHDEKPSNDVTWYKSGDHLINPRLHSHRIDISEQYRYSPLTQEHVDDFSVWVERHGDSIGRIAWAVYQMRLREAEITKKNNTGRQRDEDLKRFEKYGDWLHEDVVVKYLDYALIGIHDGWLKAYARDVFERGVQAAINALKV